MTQRELLVRDVSSRLLDAGIPAYLPNFPFASHHDYYRTRIRISGRHARRAEIAGALDSWAKRRDCDDDYVWQATCGFLLSETAKTPERRARIPEDIVNRMEAIRWGDDFAEFAGRFSLQGQEGLTEHHLQS